jgi:hypothetical protein
MPLSGLNTHRYAVNSYALAALSAGAHAPAHEAAPYCFSAREPDELQEMLARSNRYFLERVRENDLRTCLQEAVTSAPAHGGMLVRSLAERVWIEDDLKTLSMSFAL